MTWNDRVIQTGDEFAIHEVFYAEDGRIQGWTVEPVYPRAESLEELRDELLQRFAAARDEPVPQTEPDSSDGTRALQPHGR